MRRIYKAACDRSVRFSYHLRITMAIVNVWYPKLRSPQGMAKSGRPANDVYRYVDNVGHASLTLTKSSSPSYISWWPNRDHTSYQTPSYSEDVTAEGGLPTTTNLDCLDEDAIMHWWDRIRVDGRAFPYKASLFPAEDKWTLERTNCSHMVWMALKAGGAEDFAKLITWGQEIVTPPQIHLYAQRISMAAGLKKLID
ncbi:hypothetical protein GQR58_002308 [Nymphon striatum]|nr:hypothetical protein GQR58_002308 [Nymphon striatum]